MRNTYNGGYNIKTLGTGFSVPSTHNTTIYKYFNESILYFYHFLGFLTDSTTLTIMYMAVSMVINILTTIPSVSLVILKVLLCFSDAFFSLAEGK